MQSTATVSCSTSLATSASTPATARWSIDARRSLPPVTSAAMPAWRCAFSRSIAADASSLLKPLYLAASGCGIDMKSIHRYISGSVRFQYSPVSSIHTWYFISSTGLERTVVLPASNVRRAYFNELSWLSSGSGWNHETHWLRIRDGPHNSRQ